MEDRFRELNRTVFAGPRISPSLTIVWVVAIVVVVAISVIVVGASSHSQFECSGQRHCQVRDLDLTVFSGPRIPPTLTIVRVVAVVVAFAISVIVAVASSHSQFEFSPPKNC